MYSTFHTPTFDLWGLTKRKRFDSRTNELDLIVLGLVLVHLSEFIDRVRQFTSCLYLNEDCHDEENGGYCRKH